MEVDNYKDPKSTNLKQSVISIADYDKLYEFAWKQENTINQIDDAMKRVFGFNHKDYANPYDFEIDLRSMNNTIAFDACNDAFSVVDVLIHSRKWEYNIPFSEETEIEVQRYDVKQLREIADYLIVYCNARENKK